MALPSQKKVNFSINEQIQNGRRFTMVLFLKGGALDGVIHEVHGQIAPSEIGLIKNNIRYYYKVDCNNALYTGKNEEVKQKKSNDK